VFDQRPYSLQNLIYWLLLGLIMLMVFYPAGPLLARTGVRSDLARVAELLGRTRSRLLLCLAERPALSTHELATAVGISPASASEHAAVLRRNHLVEVSWRDGR